MRRIGGLAVYVTSHGFGHLNRTVAVLNRVPERVPLVIRCKPDLFHHWSERLKRPARLEAHVSDVGAINPSGDSAATDGPGTIDLARRVHAEAMARVDDEARVLRDEGIAAILCDAPAVPLVAAKRAGIPGFLLANFTWADIYEPHARKLGEEALRFVAELKAAYRHATSVFRAEPSLAMRWLGPTQDVGLVVTPGRDRGAELRRELGLTRKEKLVYFYVGRYGQSDLGWERLATIAGVHFVGFHANPGERLPNLHVIDPTKWNGADLAASANAMVVKAGYGTSCEAMAAGTPMIYPPRVGFAEHRALSRALTAWGGGIPSTTREFSEMRIERLLERAFDARPGRPPYPVDGADRVASGLVEACTRR